MDYLFLVVHSKYKEFYSIYSSGSPSNVLQPTVAAAKGVFEFE